MTTLTLVVVGRDAADLQGFSLAHVEADELVLLANPSGRFGGLGAIGNHYRESSYGDVLGLVHADVFFGPGACRALARQAARGAVVGIVGKVFGGPGVHARDIAAGGAVVAVSTLDSCGVFLPRACPVRFDEQAFDSFHCCVEDLCLQAACVGWAVQVPAVNADHLALNTAREDRQAWVDAHTRYWYRLREKWSGVAFDTC